ncbi:MAG TPA: hypothetical protein VM782_07420 [Stellaceae bacterium]|nr:hypothetical protein [Stellaceae bacterium]
MGSDQLSREAGQIRQTILGPAIEYHKVPSVDPTQPLEPLTERTKQRLAITSRVGPK